MVVFTASQQVYADALLDLLEGDRRVVHHRLFRDACLFVQGNFLKDLTVLNRELHNVRATGCALITACVLCLPVSLCVCVPVCLRACVLSVLDV